MRRARTEDNSFDRCAASWAGLIFPAVYGQRLLKESTLTINVYVEIIEGGPTFIDGFLHYFGRKVDYRAKLLFDRSAVEISG